MYEKDQLVWVILPGEKPKQCVYARQSTIKFFHFVIHENRYLSIKNPHLFDTELKAYVAYVDALGPACNKRREKLLNEIDVFTKDFDETCEYIKKLEKIRLSNV